jgi:His/Glu/Gln/Arg/opine family amino acid ABC transporter permease subunit
MDLSFIPESLPLLLKGAVMTLKITVIAGSIGLVLGTLIGLARSFGIRWLNALISVYVEVIRGTPLYTQLLIMAYGIPSVLQLNYDVFTVGLITIGVNSSAYVAEIMRAGIQSIDKGQMEAARSLGMPHGQAMVTVILPQAVRRVIPPLLNEVITLIKESSLVAVIAVVELTRTAQLIGSRTYKPFPYLVMAALIYLAMTLTLSRVTALFERRLATGD